MKNTVPLYVVIILLIIVCLQCSAYAQYYNNKDIENLKKQEQNPYPKASPQPSPSPKQKSPSAADKNTKTLKGSSQSRTEKNNSGKKITDTKKNTINYTTSEGTIKIEVKSAKTDSRKSSGKKPGRKSSNPDRKAAGEGDEKEPAPSTISDLPMVEKMLPYEKWKAEYEEYFLAHNNERTLSLEPKLIVIRCTYANSVDALWNLFARGSLYDEGDDGLVFGHLSCHFAIDRSGAIYQMLPLNVRSKGAFGVNHAAITIDLTGLMNKDLLDNELQKNALYALVEALMKNFRIPISKVYGHYEVSKGKQVVSEYTDYNDSDYPECYSPDKVCYDPGELYMKNLRNHFAKQASKGQ